MFTGFWGPPDSYSGSYTQAHFCPHSLETHDREVSWVEFLPELHLSAINHRNADFQSVTVVMTYNPGIQEAAAGKVRVSDECGLYSETLFQKIQGEREAGWGG